jgi:hypothetical protein
MKTLELNKMEGIEGGKFWGPGGTTHQPAGPGMNCECWTCNTYYVFWIAFENCDWEPCWPGNCQV